MDLTVSDLRLICPILECPKGDNIDDYKDFFKPMTGDTFFFLLILLLLFTYNCLHFLPIPPPNPSQTHLPPPPPPSPLILSLCPL